MRGAILKFAFDIKSNAIDSFDEALVKYNEGESGDVKAFKFAISHLSHSIELVLKMYLQTLDENLIFTRCYNAVLRRAKADASNLLVAFNAMAAESFDFKELLNGHPNPHTVTVDQVLSLAKHETCGITGVKFVDQEFIDDIQWMKGLRNSIEHYEFEFNPKEVRMCAGRLVRALDEFADIFSLFDLEKEVGKDRYHVFEALVDEYKHALKEALLEVEEEKEKTSCDELENEEIIENKCKSDSTTSGKNGSKTSDGTYKNKIDAHIYHTHKHIYDTKNPYSNYKKNNGILTSDNNVNHIPPHYSYFEAKMNEPTNPIVNPIKNINKNSESMFEPCMTPSMCKNTFLNSNIDNLNEINNPEHNANEITQYPKMNNLEMQNPQRQDSQMQNPQMQNPQMQNPENNMSADFSNFPNLMASSDNNSIPKPILNDFSKFGM